MTLSKILIYILSIVINHKIVTKPLAVYIQMAVDTSDILICNHTLILILFNLPRLGADACSLLRRPCLCSTASAEARIVLTV